MEDQITEKRNKLIDALHRRMSQKTSKLALFTIWWREVGAAVTGRRIWKSAFDRRTWFTTSRLAL